MVLESEKIWKPGFEGLFHADPNLVANEILEIGESATPEQIVEKAKDSNTELHKCFDWNDTVAAQKWRLHQARQVVCLLVYKSAQGQESKPKTRVFYKCERSFSVGYKATELIVKNKDEYEKLLESAYRDLQVFKSKYSSLSELEEILELIP